MSKDDDATVIREFRDAVNMTQAELRRWLDDDDSKSVGQKRGGKSESVGHEYGRHILDLLGKGRAHDPDAEELKQMRKVVGYVHRHLEQRPDGDVEDTPWRHSLMNWGHDPLKDRGGKKK